jgi:REP element-mobilizing transposase RayT
MPEHVHLLIERLGSQSISSIVRDIKKFFSYWYKNEWTVSRLSANRRFLCADRYRLWQRGYDEVTIASEKQYFVKMNYILNNPVKRGLVCQWRDYEFCYSVMLDDFNR